MRRAERRGRRRRRRLSRAAVDDTRYRRPRASRSRLPVVLVVGMRLGCINHALLTADAIAARGLQLVGWVANLVDPAMLYVDDNIDTLRQRLAREHEAPLHRPGAPLTPPSCRTQHRSICDIEALVTSMARVPPPPLPFLTSPRRTI